MLSRPALIWINRLLWTFLVGVVLLLGAVVSLGRHYLPYVETHQAQVVAELQRRTGLKISVGHMRAYWQRLSPYLIVDDFKLYNPEHPEHPEQVVLQIQHAEVRLGIFRSIDAGTIAISKLEGSGLQLSLEEAELGRWRLPGFATGTNTRFARVAELLLAIYRAELRDAQIDLHFFGGGAAHLSGGQLRLQRVGDFRRLNLTLSFAERGAPLTVVVESNGDPRHTERFSARAYTTFSGVDFTPLLPIAKTFGVDLRQGGIDGAAWLDWRPDADIEVRGRLAMPLLDLAGLTGSDLPPLKSVVAEFLVSDHAGQRRLWLPQLLLQWSDRAFNFSQLLLIEDERHPDVLQVEMPKLTLAALSEALSATPALSEHLRETLATLSPTGELHNLHIAVPSVPNRPDLFRLRAEVVDGAVGAWQGAPGATGIAGYVDMGLEAGIFDLDAGKMKLVFPHVYRDALRFDTVRGQVGWRIEPDRVLVDSGPIQTESDAGRANALFALDLPHAHDSAPLMTLMVGLQGSAAEYRNRFIPYTLSPDLLAWLDSAVNGGKVPSGGFIYRGSLVGAQHLDRTVQLFLDVRDGKLKYQPDWPQLEDVRAAVWVDDDSLLVQSPSARTLAQISASDVQVEMHPGADGSWLTVVGDITARNDDALRLLIESPLHQKVGAVLDRWHWRGRVDAKLDLGFALSGSRPQELRVDTQLQGGELLIADQSLTLTDVRGPLQYRSDSGLQSSGMSANCYGKPLTAKVSSRPSGALRVDIEGLMALTDLRNWLEHPLFDYAAGEIGFKAALQLAGERSELNIDSDLQGVEIKLPPPYNKPAATTLPLALHMSFAGDRAVSASLGDWADLQLQWRDERLDEGVLRLGQAGKTSLSSGRFAITGAVRAADFDEWRQVLAGFGEAANTEAGGRDQAGGLAALALQLRDLQIAEASVMGQALRNLSLSGQHEAKGWSLHARADIVAGTIVLPEGAGQPWQVHLDYLHMPAPTPGAASSLDNVDPAKVIPIDLRVDRLWRGDEEWGWLALQLRPIPDGMQLQQLTGELRGISIEPSGEKAASLSWQRQNSRDRSQFSGRLSVEDIGPVLQRWHFEKAMTSKSGALDVDIGWLGRPDQAKLKNIDGSAQLDIADGRFLKASGSTAGALKVVGIFNFANFLRRLQLDFSDVFKDGVSFDSIQGGFALQQGVVTTAKPVDIKSPSSAFHIAGDIDFNTDQTDMELVATLPVARNLPWVAALAGGLPVAAGVYVASKVFESQVDKIASVAYDISGPWTDPKVKLRRIFDDKLPQGDAAKASSAVEKSSRKASVDNNGGLKVPEIAP